MSGLADRSSSSTGKKLGKSGYVPLWGSLFEQLLCDRAMILGGGDLGADPGDLAFQSLDALLELLDRQRIEILLHQQGERVAGLAWEELVQVHGAENPLLRPLLSS